MSGIVLSSSVRQNLLSLQSTADLLATTQNRLSTGKKVNTALDNPTNYFTAASLDSRASDISNLLDGIGNGVQVLQSANTGISSLSKVCIVGDILRKVKSHGVTVLLIEQNLHFAASVADRHYLIAEGRVVDSLDNADVKKREHELLAYLGM